MRRVGSGRHRVCKGPEVATKVGANEAQKEVDGMGRQREGQEMRREGQLGSGSCGSCEALKIQERVGVLF